MQQSCRFVLFVWACANEPYNDKIITERNPILK